MKLTVGIITRNGPNAVERVVRSAVGANEMIVVNHDCSPGHHKAVRDALPATVRFLDIAAGRGLTYAWNAIIREAVNNWVVISNDDVRFDEGWLATLAAMQKASPKALHIAMAYPKNRYGCFAIHKSLVRAIGWFDQRFTGTTCEDDDWHLRLSEYAGCPPGTRVHEDDDDGIFAACECVLHSAKFKEAGSGGGLSREVNVDFFRKKWREANDGWATKGKPLGAYMRMRRRLPEIDWYPGGIE